MRLTATTSELDCSWRFHTRSEEISLRRKRHALRGGAALAGMTIAEWKADGARYSNVPAYAEQQERFVIPGMRKAGFPER